MDLYARFLLDNPSAPSSPREIFNFGNTPQMADTLLELVLSGKKTATCALYRWYKNQGQPRPGQTSVVLDGLGRPACVIETVEAWVAPFSECTAAFARQEGEGDLSLSNWRDEHWAYFMAEAKTHGFTFNEASLLVYERFKIVFGRD